MPTGIIKALEIVYHEAVAANDISLLESTRDVIAANYRALALMNLNGASKWSTQEDMCEFVDKISQLYPQPQFTSED
jgi:hypothetical protein